MLPHLPEVSVIVATYQRPRHLLLSLMSLALQRGVEGRFEVVVTDDGSADQTPDIVNCFTKSTEFPVRFVTQEHRCFHPARCRNNGVLASRAPYLVFCDGDCIVPSNYIEQHLRARRRGVARTGDSYRLDRTISEYIDHASIRSGAFVHCVGQPERYRMRQRWVRELIYSTIRHPRRPRTMAGNLAVWRKDFERINGFDEEFVGWGCEDDDLGDRLRQSGVRIAPIFGYTQGYHLWHQPDPSRPKKWRDGANVEYFLRRKKPVLCSIGLSAHKRLAEIPHLTAPAQRAVWSPSRITAA